MSPLLPRFRLKLLPLAALAAAEGSITTATAAVSSSSPSSAKNDACGRREYVRLLRWAPPTAPAGALVAFLVAVEARATARGGPSFVEAAVAPSGRRYMCQRLRTAFSERFPPSCFAFVAHATAP